MKNTTKFISSPGGVLLLVLVDPLAITLCTGGIIGCIKTPGEPDIFFYLLAVFFGLVLGICTTCITLKIIYIVECVEDKITFRSVYLRYTIYYSQIQDIIRRDVWQGGAKYFLIVEGYQIDPNKFYPFCFERTRKTKKVVQKIWLKKLGLKYS